MVGKGFNHPSPATAAGSRIDHRFRVGRLYIGWDGDPREVSAAPRRISSMRNGWKLPAFESPAPGWKPSLPGTAPPKAAGMRPLMAAAKGSRRRLMGLGIKQTEPDRTVFRLAGLAAELNRFLKWDGPDVPIYVPVTQVLLNFLGLLQGPPLVSLNAL
eukprot:s603_g18.t1